MSAKENLQFCSIPASKLDAAALAHGLGLLNNILTGARKNPESTYYEAAVSVIKHRGAFISQIHPHFVDKHLVSLVETACVTIALNSSNFDGYGLVSQDQIDKAIQLDINFAKEVNAELVSDEALKASIQKHPKRKAEVVDVMGRCHIIDELIAEGYWPHRESNVPQKDKVDGAEDVIKLRLKKRDYSQNDKMWLNALIRSFPVSDVIPLMKTTSRKTVLLEVYDREILLRELKHDRKMMGMLVEAELGL